MLQGDRAIFDARGGIKPNKATMVQGIVMLYDNDLE
jgi:hypothetical protein